MFFSNLRTSATALVVAGFASAAMANVITPDGIVQPPQDGGRIVQPPPEYGMIVQPPQDGGRIVQPPQDGGRIVQPVEIYAAR